MATRHWGLGTPPATDITAGGPAARRDAAARQDLDRDLGAETEAPVTEPPVGEPEGFLDAEVVEPGVDEPR
ncbi:hypothetical protein [Nocardia asiatica]|uniref:hypothetical protein n=1 Tax=Nocardia asiatica TaxID=209252 RepID=UPI00245412BC|nr:hypothetical protein [Nocardia asiatica]